jgi:hypothetical protein
MLTIIDYSMPSDEKGMWVMDLASGQLKFNVHVSHGSNSGGKNSTDFSNKDGSHKSNIGVLTTAETYQGKHGYSLKLDGLEEGYNDNARSRYIVMHSADYASEDRAKQTGQLGRSWAGAVAVRQSTPSSLATSSTRSRAAA